MFGLVLAIGIVVDDAIVVVENVERNLEHGLSPTRSGAPLDGRSVDGAGRDRAGAVRGVRADHVPHRHYRRILPPVRGDHRQRDDHLAAPVADPVAGARRAAAEAEERPSGRDRRDGRASPRRRPVQRALRPLERMVWPLHPAHRRRAEARADRLCRAGRADRRPVLGDAGGLHPGAGPGLCAGRDPASARQLDRAHRRGAARRSSASCSRSPASRRR